MSDLPDIPMSADEATTLESSVDHQRADLARKTPGLDAAGLTARIGRSSMTLGGLLSHLSFVEDFWFGYVLLAQPTGPPWDRADWDADPDADWHLAARLTPTELGHADLLRESVDGLVGD